jgi:hypothetical protein
VAKSAQANRSRSMLPRFVSRAAVLLRGGHKRRLLLWNALNINNDLIS